MPGFDGTGPLGEGPMTGLGHGYCILTSHEEDPGRVKGYAGLQSLPIGQEFKDSEYAGKEVTDMPSGNAGVPVVARPGLMTGRATGAHAGFPLPGYRNPGGAWIYGSAVAMRPREPYGVASYGYATCNVAPYNRWLGRWFWRGHGVHRGFGWGRGRHGSRMRFGYRR